jgi:hypothetical protein
MSAMRPWTAVFVAFVALAPASPARAAPTCQDSQGMTIRCGVPGAMPVGWTLPANERPEPPASDMSNMWRAIALVALLLALIAALPEFDGRTSADWGEQEDDDGR